MIVRSKAPLRISFAGGGTDVSPYPERAGGAVLNTTIDKYAYCTVSRRTDETINVHSLDYDITAKYNSKADLYYDGKLDLVKAAIRVLRTQGGYDLFLHSDAPPGSGLGASSTVTVALVGALEHCLGLPFMEYDIAETAYRIEREEAGIKGGRQDQYAAAFGGFNFIEFYKNMTVVNPLRVKPEVLSELEYRLMLCFTGKTRPSAGIIEEQVSGYVQGKHEVANALDQTKELAYRMKNALLLGRLDDFGMLLHEGWEHKKKFSTKVTDPAIDELYIEARKKGAVGGKLLGAGGGGYMLLFCEFNKKHLVAERLKQLGGQIINFAFDFRGLQTWEVNNGAFAGETIFNQQPNRGIL
jgi:D-glycero-alpha-D-manno-heptose-7-phosphate kinase